MNHYDDIIIGQGLAGTTLAWQLRFRGRKVLVLDREQSTTASRIAAGLVTPVTGMRFVKSWRLDECWPVAVQFYQRVAEILDVNIFCEQPAVRLFRSAAERKVYEKRRSAGQFDGLIFESLQQLDSEYYHQPFGSFVMRAGQLDAKNYLNASREIFANEECYQCCNIDLDADIQQESGCVILPALDVAAERLFFCEGFAATRNPWFQAIPFDAVKGEILMLRIPGLSEARVVHGGIWLAPHGDELYSVGATYDREHLDDYVTAAGREQILEAVRQIIKVPVSVVEHYAAVRPVLTGRHPVAGLHPQFPQFGYLNGLGSKGSLQAPWVAERFVEHLLDGVPLPEDIDVQRRGHGAEQ